NQHYNTFQSIIVISLHLYNIPKKIVKIITRLGLLISMGSICNAIHSLSQKAHQYI
ncbi:hypothetical protein HETIRDRAFT_316396, partial [Heterobasidion irregulare TC 32-1]